MKRLAIMLGMASVIALTACSEEKSEPTPEIIRPVLSTVVKANGALQDVLVGTVESQVSAQLAFRLLGRLVSREVDIGDLVNKETTIASLDPSQLQLQLDGARANLAGALAQATNASASEERQRALLESRNTPQAAYDAARQARDAANAGVEQAQAAVTKAEEQLSYARLYCDFDGVVTAVGAQVGQVVSPGEMVVTVARADLRDAVFDVPAQLVTNLKIGTAFDVSLQSAPSIKATGKVREIAPQADNATRTQRVRLALEDAPAAFRLGSTVSVSRDVTEKPVIHLPETVVVKEGERSFVWIVEGDAVQQRDVKLGPATPLGLEIEQGLKDGDRVVTAGVHSLKPGQKVKVEVQELAQ